MPTRKISQKPLQIARRNIATVVRIVAIGILLYILHSNNLFALTTYNVPGSINSTCASDVTESLSDWIDTVPNNAKILFEAGGCYNIEGGLVVKDRSNLTFDGNNATFEMFTDGTSYPTPEVDETRRYLNWPRIRPHWMIYNSRDIVMKNMTIQGANPNAGPTNDAYISSLEEQAGFLVQSESNNVVIENTNIHDTYGDFVEVIHSASNVVIKNNNFDRSGRQGIAIVHGSSIEVSNNYIANTGRSVIDIEPATTAWDVDNVSITNNTIGRANGVFIAAGGQGGLVTNITVDSNTLNNEELIVIFGDQNEDAGQPNRANVKITNNTTNRTHGSPIAGIRFYSTDNVLIQNNVQQLATTQSRMAVYARDVNGITVRDNSFIGSTLSTIFTYESTSSRLECNNEYDANLYSAACPVENETSNGGSESSNSSGSTSNSNTNTDDSSASDSDNTKKSDEKDVDSADETANGSPANSPSEPSGNIANGSEQQDKSKSMLQPQFIAAATAMLIPIILLVKRKLK